MPTIPNILDLVKDLNESFEAMLKDPLNRDINAKLLKVLNITHYMFLHTHSEKDKQIILDSSYKELFEFFKIGETK